MGERSHRKSQKSSKRKYRSKYDEYDSDTSSPSSSSSSSSPYSSGDDDDDSKKRSRKRRHRSSDERHRRKSSSRKDKKESRGRRKSKNKSKRDDKVKERNYSDSDSGESEDGSRRYNPEQVVKCILKEFPAVAGDLELLLQMIDDGQAVDIKGLSEGALIKNLRRLFLSLNLKETGDHVFLLKSKQHPTLEVVGPIIHDHVQPHKQQLDNATSGNDTHAEPPDARPEQVTDDVQISNPSGDTIGPRRRVIGPEMPSAELLAAAAKLTEAEAELREAELDDDSEFIGPPPPAVVAEAESSNEAERFEEITRIMGAEVDSAYDVLGVNLNMSAENVKKRYWKLSLMVHPDKCSHPQAHQAFVKLNKAFKDLQDPDKRKAFDEKIKLKEEQEKLKAGLKEMREAAQWRRLQGISMEGDDILLAEMEVKVEPKRDEWMTTLPPERKPGVSMRSTTQFSRSSKEGRGDTSAWTDTPVERAHKAKMSYLEAFNEASALGSNDQERRRSNSEAELVDQYNKSKRSKSLVEKHRDSMQSRSKKKSKLEPVKEEWEGNHPWKPWDREKDLTAGRQNVKLDPENMGGGLSSRFSSGSFQRNFL